MNIGLWGSTESTRHWTPAEDEPLTEAPHLSAQTNSIEHSFVPPPDVTFTSTEPDLPLHLKAASVHIRKTRVTAQL